MNVEVFVLCDAATQQQGKLYILGSFDTIYAKQLPVKHYGCSVATRIRFEKAEDGLHSVKIKIIDENGKEISPKLEASIEVGVGESRDSAVTNLILNIRKLEFEQDGQYKIELYIDGKIRKTLPLFVEKLPLKE